MINVELWNAVGGIYKIRKFENVGNAYGINILNFQAQRSRKARAIHG